MEQMFKQSMEAMQKINSRDAKGSGQIQMTSPSIICPVVQTTIQKKKISHQGIKSYHPACDQANPAYVHQEVKPYPSRDQANSACEGEKDCQNMPNTS